MAQTYRPMQLQSGIVERLNEFKERLGTQVFMNPQALGLGACIGVLLDIEAFVCKNDRCPTHAEVKDIAAAYPQRGRKRVSERAGDVDRGHKLEPDGQDLERDGHKVRRCSACGMRFGDDEEIFASCLGSPDSPSGEPGATVKP